MRALPAIPDEIIQMIMQHVRVPLHHRMLMRSIRSAAYEQRRDVLECGECIDYVRQRSTFLLDRVTTRARNDCGCDAETNALCSECKIALCGEHMHWGCMCREIR